MDKIIHWFMMNITWWSIAYTLVLLTILHYYDWGAAGLALLVYVTVASSTEATEERKRKHMRQPK